MFVKQVLIECNLTIFFSMKYAALAIGFLAVSIPAFAQETTGNEESSRVKVQIIEEEGGDRTVREQHYDIGKRTQQQQREYLDSLLTELGKEGKGKNRRITVTMEEGNLKDLPVRIAKKGFPANPDKMQTFGWEGGNAYWQEFDRLGSRVDSSLTRKFKKIEMKTNRLLADVESRADFNFDFGKHFENLKSLSWEANTSKTVRAVSIHPNQPFDGLLNVRFSTPSKGDVTITVTDTKGNEQGKKVLKNFDGEFVGQIKLKDSAKGVLFVNIVQNDDGISQRISLPAQDK